MCRTLKNTGRNYGGFMNSIYDRTFKGCNTRGIGKRIGPTFTVAFVVTQEIRDSYRIRVNCYKITGKFIQESRRFVKVCGISN